MKFCTNVFPSNFNLQLYDCTKLIQQNRFFQNLIRKTRIGDNRTKPAGIRKVLFFLSQYIHIYVYYKLFSSIENGRIDFKTEEKCKV